MEFGLTEGYFKVFIEAVDFSCALGEGIVYLSKGWAHGKQRKMISDF